MPHTKYIFVTGGVISGLGKGIATASVALLLKQAGFKVSPLKSDMYLNLDAGTMNPFEHGEVFVTDDGIETDQDIGHYERFLGENLQRKNYITSGMVYWEVLRKERCLEYEGKCVEVFPFVPDQIMQFFATAGKGADFLVTELGGTVGEYQNIVFLETARRLASRQPGDVCFIHLGYLPIPKSLGEMKTKPIQQSITALNSVGIWPDIVICRGEHQIDDVRREKIALAAGLPKKAVISSPDLGNIYASPLVLEKQGLTQLIYEKLQLEGRKPKLDQLSTFIQKTKKITKKVNIAIVAKYYSSGNFSLEDSYISVTEAVKHAAWHLDSQVNIHWYDSAAGEKKGFQGLEKMDGIIVPQGWGSRGVEGKIKAVEYARRKKIPYLGLCFGMQMAVIEFARHKAGLANANSTEVNPETPDPVIHIMPDQNSYLKKKQYGGTIRLGSWPAKLTQGSLLANAYKNTVNIQERHRHRYEFNMEYREKLEKAGLILSAISPDGKLVEAIELPKSVHPFFVGTQFHPELKSRPLSPHPLFIAFIKSALKRVKH